MGEASFFEKGVAIIQEATTLDQGRQFEDALAKYELGIKYLLTHLKYEKHESSKKSITEKVTAYLNRAEDLKKFIASGGKAVPGRGGGPSGGGTGGARSSTGGGPAQKTPADDDEDPDKAKLRTALDSAIVKEKPNVKWDDVAGLEGAKAALREAVILPVKFPHLFTGKRQPWKGILLYGPPGTGKSHLAKAVATEVDSTFFSVSSSDLVSKWLGESERLVRSLFEMARESRPAIIFIDEVDSLCGSRSDSESESARRIKTEFLVQMQGVGTGGEGGVLVLAATNLPWALDSAIRRRFERRIYIPLPDVNARERMIHIHLGDTANTLQPHEFKVLAQRTEGFSGSDLSIMVRDALMEPVRRLQQATHFRRMRGVDPQGRMVDDLWEPCSPGAQGAEKKTLMDVEPSKLATPKITFADFEKSLRTSRPSVNQADLVKYVEWTKEFGQDA